MSLAWKMERVQELMDFGLISREEAMSFMGVNLTNITEAMERYTARRKAELDNEADRIKASWDPDKKCQKCGREYVWVKAALVCVEHGWSGKGC